MRKNCFVESAILYPKTVKFENLKKIAQAQFSLALPHIYVVFFMGEVFSLWVKYIYVVFSMGEVYRWGVLYGEVYICGVLYG